MAGKYSDKHVFPLLLNAAEQTKTTGNLPVDTSYVQVNPASDGESFTLPDGTIPGQIMTIINISASNDAEIAVTTPFSDEYETIDLTTDKAHASLIWNGEKWVVLAGVPQASLVTD